MQISKELKNKNALYAIKIAGRFDHIKTRAFPPVKNEPLPAVMSIPTGKDFQNFKFDTKNNKTLKRVEQRQ